jgi:hypothetical protein
MIKWPDKDKPYFDLKPTVIPDFFSKSEYKGLYKLIEDNRKEENFEVQTNPHMGYFAENIYLEKPYNEYSELMVDKINKVYPLDSDPTKHMFIYNRYTWKTEHEPVLKPHFDTMIDHGSITLTIVLDTTLDWNIVAEDEEFEIKSNQAFLFSGTHHLHWRPKIEFGPDDYYDFLLCQFTDKNPVLLDNKYWDEMVKNRSEASTDWWKKYESNGLLKPQTKTD